MAISRRPFLSLKDSQNSMEYFPIEVLLALPVVQINPQGVEGHLGLTSRQMLYWKFLLICFLAVDIATWPLQQFKAVSPTVSHVHVMWACCRDHSHVSFKWFDGASQVKRRRGRRAQTDWRSSIAHWKGDSYETEEWERGCSATMNHSSECEFHNIEKKRNPPFVFYTSCTPHWPGDYLGCKQQHRYTCKTMEHIARLLFGVFFFFRVVLRVFFHLVSSCLCVCLWVLYRTKGWRYCLCVFMCKC